MNGCFPAIAAAVVVPSKGRAQGDWGDVLEKDNDSSTGTKPIKGIVWSARTIHLDLRTSSVRLVPLPESEGQEMELPETSNVGVQISFR